LVHHYLAARSRTPGHPASADASQKISTTTISAAMQLSVIALCRSPSSLLLRVLHQRFSRIAG
jgi:hypothetical protein